MGGGLPCSSRPAGVFPPLFLRSCASQILRLQAGCFCAFSSRTAPNCHLATFAKSENVAPARFSELRIIRPGNLRSLGCFSTLCKPGAAQSLGSPDRQDGPLLGCPACAQEPHSASLWGASLRPPKLAGNAPERNTRALGGLCGRPALLRLLSPGNVKAPPRLRQGCRRGRSSMSPAFCFAGLASCLFP